MQGIPRAVLLHNTRGVEKEILSAHVGVVAEEEDVTP